MPHAWKGSPWLKSSSSCAAGGVLSDSLIAHQTPESIRAVFAPKVDGAKKLKRGLQGSPLVHFTAFSSVAAFIGSAGQASYAAANAAMDEIMEGMRSCGLPGTSLAHGKGCAAYEWLHLGALSKLIKLHSLALLATEEGCFGA